MSDDHCWYCGNSDAQIESLQKQLAEAREALNSFGMVRVAKPDGGYMYSFNCFDMADTYAKLEALTQPKE